MDVSKLIADLKAQGVASFKGYGIEVEFHRHREQATPSLISDIHAEMSPKTKQDLAYTENPATALADHSAGLAQSVDAEIPYDKILHWSGSPDASMPETPLAGDAAALTNDQG